MVKARFIRVIPVLSSFGCPFECEFCSDANVDHRPLPLSDVEEDIRYAAESYPNALLIWLDPNFGVRFEPLMDAIDRAGNGAVRFGAQSSLSFLSSERLERLARARFEIIVPGLEDWFSCGAKLGGAGRAKGRDRVREAAASVNGVLGAIPYVQVNFVFGLEGEPLGEGFELTEDFVRAVPAAWPTFNLITAWGVSSPLSRRLRAEGRILPVPFPLLDQKSCSNVVRPDGTVVDLYRGLLHLEERAYGVLRSGRRALGARRWEARMINLVRGRGAEMRERLRWHRRMAHLLEHDRRFRGFFEGDPVGIPIELRERALWATGPFVAFLPSETLAELRTGTVALS